MAGGPGKPRPPVTGSVANGVFKKKTPAKVNIPATPRGGTTSRYPNPANRPDWLNPATMGGRGRYGGRSPGLSPSAAAGHEFNSYVDGVLPDEYDDTANGMTPAELANLIWKMNNRDDGGGGGGGGGAAEVDVVSPETIAAYQQMLNAIINQGTSENAALDAQGTALTGMREQGDARLRAIMAELAASRASAQTAAQSGFANTDGQLQQMSQQYAQGASQRDAGMNRSLGAFGVEALNGGSGGELESLFGAMRGTNTMLGNVSDQGYNNRANVHAGLGADTQLRDQQQFAMFQAQLAAQRQAAANADAQRRAQLAIQAAQAGVTL